jgi:glutathione peroxidase
MKRLFLPLVLLSMMACAGEKKNTVDQKITETKDETKTTEMKSIYDFKVKDIDGNAFDFASLKGKKIMIVNTASECGYTPQYEQLEELYQEFKTKILRSWHFLQIISADRNRELIQILKHSAQKIMV